MRLFVGLHLLIELLLCHLTEVVGTSWKMATWRSQENMCTVKHQQVNPCSLAHLPIVLLEFSLIVAAVSTVWFFVGLHLLIEPLLNHLDGTSWKNLEITGKPSRSYKK